MSEVEYLPVSPGFNPAAPEYAGWRGERPPYEPSADPAESEPAADAPTEPVPPLPKPRGKR
jgi:hypothetical protein